MKIKLPRLIDEMVIFLSVFLIFPAPWLGISVQILIFTDIIIFLDILLYFNRYFKTGTIIPLLFILAIYPFVNYILLGGESHSLLANIERLSPLLIMTFYSEKCLYNSDFIKFKFKRFLTLFNLFFLVNIPVLLMQKGGDISLVGVGDGNDYLPDLISGFFGYGGTHRLGLFSSFLILYNFFVIFSIGKTLYKTIFLIYNCAIFAFTLYISAFNDNKSYYIVFALEGAILYFIYLNSKNSLGIKVKRLFTIIVSLPFIVPMVVYYIVHSAFGSETLNTLSNSIKILLSSFSLGNQSLGGAERFGMIGYYINKFDMIEKIFGKGLGLSSWGKPGTLGFFHFGQADFGTSLLLGGIILALLLVWYLYAFFKAMGASSYENFFLYGVYAFLSLYTNIFTDPSLTVISIWYVCLCCKICKIKTNEWEKLDSLQSRYRIVKLS